MDKQDLETKAQFSRRVGVSRARVSQWAKDGLPLTKDGRVRINAALKWLQDRVPQPARYRDRGIHRVTEGAAQAPEIGPHREDAPGPIVAGGKIADTYLKARAAKMLSDAQRSKVEAQRAQIELAARKCELVDRARTTALVFKLARDERDAWLNWPARVSALMAADLGIDPHKMHVALEKHVREHLIELAEIRPRFE